MILSMNNPPYSITPQILNSIIEIAEKTGQINALFLERSTPELRKENRIKTIHSSLKIEGNTLSEEQITALIEEKRVLGPQKDIIEVNNAIKVYDKIKEFNPHSEKDFLKAHRLMTQKLIEESGKYRNSGVGIVKGNQVAHIAPSAIMVPGLMKDLFKYLKTNKDHELIKSIVFHYELEFIHPFSDGNGRMGRLWNTVILMKAFPVFEYIPFESIIAKYQEGYYKALATADKKGESTDFILFMLNIINESLEPFLNSKEVNLKSEDRLDLFLSQVDGDFSRADYLKFFKNISSPTASRDLAKAVKDFKVKKIGDKRNTTYRKIN